VALRSGDVHAGSVRAPDFDTKASGWQADAGSYTLSLSISVSEILAKTVVRLSRTLHIGVAEQIASPAN
jgi:beta-glucosidase